MAHTADWTEPPRVLVNIFEPLQAGSIFLRLLRPAPTLFCSSGTVAEQCGPDNCADSSTLSWFSLETIMAYGKDLTSNPIPSRHRFQP